MNITYTNKKGIEKFVKEHTLNRLTSEHVGNSKFKYRKASDFINHLENRNIRVGKLWHPDQEK